MVEREGVKDEMTRIASVYAGITNVYFPYYRQAKIINIEDNKNVVSTPFDKAYGDCKRAFDSFIEQTKDNGRGMILSGHS